MVNSQLTQNLVYRSTHLHQSLIISTQRSMYRSIHLHHCQLLVYTSIHNVPREVSKGYNECNMAIIMGQTDYVVRGNNIIIKGSIPTTFYYYIISSKYIVVLFHDYDHISFIIPLGYLPRYPILSFTCTFHAMCMMYYIFVN